MGFDKWEIFVTEDNDVATDLRSLKLSVNKDVCDIFYTYNVNVRTFKMCKHRVVIIIIDNPLHFCFLNGYNGIIFYMF